MSVRWFSNIFHVKDGNTYKNMGVLKGEKGDMGPKGDPGNDGYSPTASVAKSGHTSTITITDKNGTTTAQVTDGSDASVDVQINGTSIMNQGVANIPLASSSGAGVSKINGFGLAMSGDIEIISSANANNVKAGSSNYYPIVPAHQHESAFYGLAKAAGDTTQAQSSNAVGTYTDSAKASIRTMLGTLSATSDVITIAANNWSNDGSCTKNVTGVTSSNTVIVTYHPMFEEEYTAAGIWCTGQGNGVLYFSCKNIPSTAISVNVLILNGVYDQS